MDSKIKLIFQKKLQDWYHLNKRDLPWRSSKDPYNIWISEIILQQTRVAQGYNYFNQFLIEFPSVGVLAEADESKVLKVWQGLGYYSRARNMHKTAQIIQNKYSSKFPTNYDDIISLPGIGEYTAAAIVSFAYDQNYAVVDGNVFRVLARLFDNDTPIDTSQGKRLFSSIAQDLLDLGNPALHNQAMMEFGALHCTPKNPNCGSCPFSDYCKAFQNNTVEFLPVKKGKTKVRNRYFNYFYIQFGNKIYLQQRTEKDIWKNLYELALIETKKEIDVLELVEESTFKSLFQDTEYIISSKVFKQKHVLSHQNIFATFYTICIKSKNDEINKFVEVPTSEIEHYPISRLTELFLENMF